MRPGLVLEWGRVTVLVWVVEQPPRPPPPGIADREEPGGIGCTARNRAERSPFAWVSQAVRVSRGVVPASELGLALVRELGLAKDLEMELEKAKDLEKELELVSAPASKLLHQKDQECSSAQVNQLVESPAGPSLLRNWSPTKAEHRSTMPEDASAWFTLQSNESV